MIEESFELDNDRFDATSTATAIVRFDNEDPPQLVEAEDRGAVSPDWSNAHCRCVVNSLTISSTMLAIEVHCKK
jgi:hypothetical protein